MNDAEQNTILEHLRTEVFDTEDASIVSADEEYLTLMADMYGKLEFAVNKTGLSVDGLKTIWISHSSDCSKCTGWSLL